MYRIYNMSLRKYCMLNSLPYKNIINWARNHKDIPIEDVVEMYQTKTKAERSPIEYSFNGKNLREYCEDNNLNYGCITQYKWRHKVSIEEAIEGWLNRRKRIIYDVGGKSLKKYCEDNNLIHKYHNILDYRARHNCPIENAIERFIK